MKMKIGISKKVLKGKMKKAGMKNYEDLADAAGITSRTIYNVFSEDGFRVGTLASLATALRTDPRDLLEVTDVPD